VSIPVERAVEQQALDVIAPELPGGRQLALGGVDRLVARAPNDDDRDLAGAPDRRGSEDGPVSVFGGDGGRDPRVEQDLAEQIVAQRGGCCAGRG